MKSRSQACQICGKSDVIAAATNLTMLEAMVAVAFRLAALSGSAGNRFLLVWPTGRA